MVAVDIESIKAKGNAYYLKKDYVKALSCYSSGISKDPKNAVLYSNSAACSFEMGNYNLAIHYSENCLERLGCPKLSDPVNRLSDIKAIEDKEALDALLTSPLLKKALVRMIKASIHLCDFPRAQGCLEVLDHFKLGTSELCDQIASIRQALTHPGKVTLTKEEAQSIPVPRYRAIPQYSALEYYTVGHDTAKSALTGRIEYSDYDCRHDNKKRLFYLFKELADETAVSAKKLLTEPFSVFLGGVGDARHLYVSLVDVHNKAKTAPKKQRMGKRLKVHFVLNDIQASALARDVFILVCLWKLKDIPGTKEGLQEFKLLHAVVYYAYLGILMPPTVFVRFVDLLSEMTEWGRLSDHCPIISLSNGLWAKIKTRYNFWISIKDSARSSDFLDNYRLPNYRAGSFDTPDMNPVIAAMVDAAYAKNQGNELEKLAGPNGMPLLGCELEKIMFQKARLLWPPKDLEGCESSHTLVNKMIKNGIYRTKETLSRTYIQDFREGWRPNLTLIDKGWSEVASTHWTFCPYDVMEQLYRYDWLGEPTTSTRLYDWSENFFGQVVKALRFLTEGNNRLVLELSNEDLFRCLSNYGADEEYRTEHGYPVKFDRMFLSNVADYVGMLPVLAHAPRFLTRSPFSAIDSNILLNTSFFSGYGEFLFRSCGVRSATDAERAFGMKMTAGGLFDMVDPRWTHCGEVERKPLNQLFDREEFVAWIQRVAVVAIYPPMQDSHKVMRETFPMSLGGFFDLLVRLTEIGYPSHWIREAIMPFLRGDPVEDSSYHSKTGREKVDTATVIGEFQMLTALYAPILGILPTLGPVPAEVDVARLLIPYQGSKAQTVLNYHVLSAIIGPNIPRNVRSFLMNAQTPRSKRKGTAQTPFKVLLQEKCQSYSCLYWGDNMVENEKALYMLMPMWQFLEFTKADATIAIIRTDSWEFEDICDVCDLVPMRGF
ncbi:hypothetical protein HDU97_006045 [Phlyctochytrium planicorne]|nr:hypothetical protein HDU97_006045 [Phlyctochytrium planicorne]